MSSISFAFAAWVRSRTPNIDEAATSSAVAAFVKGTTTQYLFNEVRKLKKGGEGDGQ